MDLKKLPAILAKTAAAGAVLSIGTFKRGNITASISNALFLGGIILLIYSLFEYVLYTGFFNGVIYGFTKIIEALMNKAYDPKTSVHGSRPEYDSKHKRGKVCKEEFAASGILLALSLLLALIS